MSSEGVGSYWPFVSGLRVTQANALLDHFNTYRRTRYILCPNQYIGAWKVGFYPQWIAREYLARRGSSRFQPHQIRPARCSLLGYAMHQIQVEGQQIPRWFLQVDTQPEVGEESYDQGAQTLGTFFRTFLKDYLEDDLNPLGRQIIDCCLNGGTLEDYEKIILTNRNRSTSALPPKRSVRVSWLHFRPKPFMGLGRMRWMLGLWPGFSRPRVAPTMIH